MDFESGADSIDLSAALSSVGYSNDNVTQPSAADLPADILDLISGSDDSLVCSVAHLMMPATY